MQNTNHQNKEAIHYSQNIVKHETFIEETGDQSEDDRTHENLDPAVFYPMFAWQVKTEKYAPKLGKMTIGEYEKILEPAQKWVRFPGRMSIAFPIQTMQPIIRSMTDNTKQVPPVVDMYRRRIMYAKLDLDELFQAAGIEKWMLIPIHVLNKLRSRSINPKTMFERNGLFPLDWFDYSKHDSMSQDDWLNLGLLDGVRHPIPAKALLPAYQGRNLSGTSLNHQLPSFLDFEDVAIPEDVDYETIRNEIYSWRYVAVKEYDKTSEKWIVTDLDTALNYKVPRIFLMFIAENPHQFVQRVKNALKNRAAAENRLKFELVVDCLLMTGQQQLSPQTLGRMHLLATANIKFIINEQFNKDLLAQVNLNFQRILTTYEFKDFLKKHPEEFPKLSLPAEEVHTRTKSLPIMDRKYFINLRRLVKRIHILYVADAVNAMYKVATDCKNIETMSLFTFSLGKTANLADFLYAQQNSTNTIAKFLKGFWIENMAGQVCMCLRAIGKGWLDLTIRDWWVYQNSKIFRFIHQIKLRMQDSLQFFLESSILQYSKYLRLPCDALLQVASNFVWENDLKTSPFQQSGSPVFSMLLNLGPDGAFYSTVPEDFAPTLVKIYEDALLLIMGIPQIDADIMTNLVFAKNLCIPTLELIEDLILCHRELIRNAYDKAIIPLKAYALKYETYIELFMTNVVDYINDFAEANKTSQEVKEEILRHKRIKDNLKQTIPQSMSIGPFFVNVDPLKQVLIEKRKDIVRKLLEYFCNRMRTTTEESIDQFRAIMTKITEKSTSIEQIMDVREFMITVPALVETLEDKVRITTLEYDILDGFWYNLSDEHFALKWEAIGWPHKILMQLPVTREQHKHDIEEFKKVQINELQTFEIRMDTLNDEIAAYTLIFDSTKAQEVSVDIKKTWKSIIELQKFGELLQSRQALFEFPDLDLTGLDGLSMSFEPYKELWLACADLIKLEDLAYGNPLANIVLEDIKATLQTIEDTLKESAQIFFEKEDIKEITDTYLARIEQFKPSLEIMECLKNPNWLMLHWQELARRAEIDLKFSVAINFGYCIKKGILDHVDVLRDICGRATYEAEEILRAIEEQERLKMEADQALLRRRKQRKCRTDI